MILNPRSSLLLEEPPLQVLPSLAVAIGLHEAIVLQQLYFLLRNPRNGRLCSDGERYIFNTYEQWHKDHFRFITLRTVERTFVALEKMGLIISCQPEGVMSRRKYYRIGIGALSKLTFGQFDEKDAEGAKLADSMPQKSVIPLTETTHKEETHEPTRVASTRVEMTFPPSIEQVIARANEQGIASAVAKRFFHFNEFTQWTTKARHSGQIRPIRNWMLALAAFARSDRLRKPAIDAITNDDFWKWVGETIHVDDRAFVNDWIDINKRRGWKQLNKMNGCMEPIVDFRKSALGYVNFCTGAGVYPKS